MDKQMGNGKKKFTIWLLLILVVLLAGAILYYRLTMGHMLETQEISDDGYTVKWDNKKYVGKYEGEYSNSKPNGEGTFTSDDGELTYEGNWKKGKFDGEGTITYSDGTWETGEYKAGKRNGKILVHNSNTAYQEIFYNMDRPYGVSNMFLNDTLQEKILYIDGIEVDQLVSKAIKLDDESIKNLKYKDSYICIEGNIKFIGQDDSMCYFRIETDTVGMVIGSYSNEITLFDEQAVIPNMSVGERVRIYGYYKDNSKNLFIEDKECYNYNYINITPLYGEVLEDNINEDSEQNNYETIQKNPYLFINESCQGDFIINKILKKGKNSYILAYKKNSKKEIVCFYYSSINNPCLYDGKLIKVNGVYCGQYKELNSKDISNYLKYNSSNNGSIDTFQYNVFPLVKINNIE